MGQVVKFSPADAARDPDAVLEAAQGQYQDVVVIGYDHDGDMDVRASLGLDLANVIFLMELFKAMAVSGDLAE